jgi:hypothetical protein
MKKEEVKESGALSCEAKNDFVGEPKEERAEEEFPLSKTAEAEKNILDF